MRFYLLNVTGLALLTAAHMAGLLMPLFLEDKTGITAAIFAVFVVSLGLVWLGRWRLVDFAITALPILGLMGTIWGFRITFGGLVGDEIALRDLGIAVALNTTFVGAGCSLWLGLNERLLKC